MSTYRQAHDASHLQRPSAREISWLVSPLEPVPGYPPLARVSAQFAFEAHRRAASKIGGRAFSQCHVRPERQVP